jgi:hypothetical protein
MLAAHHLWEQTPPGKTADAETFTRVLEALDRETGERFERTWDLLSDKPNQRKVLAALASSDDTLYGKRTLERFGLERGSARAAAMALINWGEVQRVMPSGFVIVDPLLERWLVQTQT